MRTFGTILCATDFSLFSERAFVHAAALAHAVGARLFVVHAMHGQEAPLDDYPPFMTRVDAVPDVERRLRARLEGFVSPAVKAGVDVTAEVVKGEPLPVLLGRAAELPADLLVIGSHGHGGFERWVLGSISDDLVRRAPCPVLTVPRPAVEHAAAGRGEPELLAGGTYLCGVDFSDASVRALEKALALASETKARVVAVNVVAEFSDKEAKWPAHFEVPELRAALETEAAARLSLVVAAAVKRSGTPESVEERVVAGRSWRRILDLSREYPASILFLGAHGHAPLDALFFGSTASHSLRDAPCAVLTVRGAMAPPRAL